MTALAERALKVDEVMAMTGLSRPSIYRLESTGRFVKRRRLSANRVAWLESEILAWLRDRPVAAVDWSAV